MIAFQNITSSLTLTDLQVTSLGLVADCSNADITVTLPTIGIESKHGTLVYITKSDSTLNYVHVVKDDGTDFNLVGFDILSSNFPYDISIFMIVNNTWYCAWAGNFS